MFGRGLAARNDCGGNSGGRSRPTVAGANSGGLLVNTAKQVSVFLENKPGRLANVLSALEREKVNVTGMTVMDSHEHSVLRLVTSDPVKTVQVMKSLGTPFAETEVLLVELKNHPGALAHMCEQLAGDHINID